MREADSFESMSTALTCTYTDKAGEVVRLSMAKISSAIPDKDFRMATCPKCPTMEKWFQGMPIEPWMSGSYKKTHISFHD